MIFFSFCVNIENMYYIWFCFFGELKCNGFLKKFYLEKVELMVFKMNDSLKIILRFYDIL